MTRLNEDLVILIDLVTLIDLVASIYPVTLIDLEDAAFIFPLKIKI